MPTYQLGFTVAAGKAASAPMFAIRATTRRLRIKEVRLICADATQTTLGLTVPLATQNPSPVASVSIVPVTIDPADTAASTSLIDTAWTTLPSLPAGSPTPWSRLEVLAGVVGQGLVWTPDVFDKIPLPVAQSVPGQVVVFNAGGAASGAIVVTVRLEE